ncbi:MAG: ATP synthase subunit I [Oscillospiraceae bacterium]
MLFDMIFPEVKKVSITLLIINIFSVIISIIMKEFNMAIILGIFLGDVYTLLNFILLGTVVKEALDKSAHSAKRHIQLNYGFRFVLMAAVLALSFYFPFINGWCVAATLLAPKLTYSILGIVSSIKK